MLPTRYIEDQKKRFRSRKLPQELYGRAIESFVVVCTDAVIINRKKKLFYLAKRKHKPMSGRHCFIGGRMLAFESPGDSVVRCFARETSLRLGQKRFGFILMNEYIFKDREQAPQSSGNHSLCYTFAIELNKKELARAAANLEPEEYFATEGLHAFSRRDLVRTKVFPAILDLYDTIFPG